MEALPGKSLVQLDLFPESKPEPVGLADHERALQVRYDTLAARFRLPPARVVISTRRATGGAIQYGPPHLIRISGHMSAEDRLQTLLHEVAHAICHLRHGPEEGHSRRFWAVARQLGVERKAAPETDRLRLVRTANARYAYRCVGCGEEWTRRKPFGRARLCAACERGGRPARLVLIRRPSPRRRAGS
jgi:predicted SprT family Zn-dependent metalloprotease